MDVRTGPGQRKTGYTYPSIFRMDDTRPSCSQAVLPPRNQRIGIPPYIAWNAFDNIHYLNHPNYHGLYIQAHTR
jgi:hypothetical protein